MVNKVNPLTIGGLAKATGVHVETIRYYQRRGLLSEPQRPPGGIRRYGSADIDRLTFVKSGQNLGFSLDEIIDLLRLEDGAHCQEASVLAEHKLKSVREKIKKLERIESVLSDMVARCHEQKGDIACPLIASLHTGISKVPETDL
ncbi:MULTISPECIES: Hg(II)-responsive transcriptional regulator [Marinobacter]|jgi:MerR family transcriptional regulator, mercuric resistance operon regulatory protein|uniref:Hg(II)-responsive transcriptional regulator n=2 Tax=Marinobacteraceae TaxID=2887365 RepID=UPI00257BF0F1|nr:MULTISPECIES: Hg(II)-responsive transcriptional regulator [Marinobacter]WOI18514.1 Hg(II)-responsive transcriptional regulator [Marinobacter salarius]|tara:strand:- start:672 stop:1106 length:435 start_codon:yes stop_codon:yes gene_type:complete